MNISLALHKIPGLSRLVDRMTFRLRELVATAVSDIDGWSPNALLDFEARLHRDVARECVDPLVGHFVQAAQSAADVRAAACLLVASRPHARLQKRDEAVAVRLLGGSTYSLSVPYFLRRPPRLGGASPGRGVQGNGFYPTLEVLGIYARATPATASEVARCLATSPLEEALKSLSTRGLTMDRKVANRIAHTVARLGLDYREWLGREVEAGHRGDQAKGMRIVIGLDGGRLRTRVTRRVGRKRKSGHRGYDGVWREPKVLTIYEIDSRGRKRRTGLLRYDATMRDANGLFQILATYLASRGGPHCQDSMRGFLS